jgi:hypothetical protein
LSIQETLANVTVALPLKTAAQWMQIRLRFSTATRYSGVYGERRFGTMD